MKDFRSSLKQKDITVALKTITKASAIMSGTGLILDYRTFMFENWCKRKGMTVEL